MNETDILQTIDVISNTDYFLSNICFALCLLVFLFAFLIGYKIGGGNS